MKNQQLTTIKVDQKKIGRPAGSRSTALARKAIIHELEIANEQRRKKGLTLYDLDHFSSVGRMTRAAVLHEMEMDENWEIMNTAERVDACRILMGHWREVASYEARKSPTMTVEEVQRENQPESEKQSMESWVMQTIREKSTADKKAALAEADAQRNNYVEP
jgi:hypothetical protein